MINRQLETRPIPDLNKSDIRRTQEAPPVNAEIMKLVQAFIHELNLDEYFPDPDIVFEIGNGIYMEAAKLGEAIAKSKFPQVMEDPMVRERVGLIKGEARMLAFWRTSLDRKPASLHKGQDNPLVLNLIEDIIQNAQRKPKGE